MKKKKNYQYMCKEETDVDLEIYMLAYNQEKFIGQAIESILMQQTKYSYKLVIGEDCSTDSTRKIVMDYYNKYPERIVLYLWEENVGVKENSLEILKRCSGKYIAHLEGDDYWTDPLKLEKQISFLETHPEYIGTAHNVRCVNQDGKLLHCDFGLYPICEEHVYGEEQASRIELVGQTASLVYRNIWKNQTKEQKEAYVKYIGNGDIKVSVLLGLSGDVYYFRDVMSDHRRCFVGPSWTARTKNKNMFWINYCYHCGTKKYIEKCTQKELSTANWFHFFFQESCMKALSEPNIENISVLGRFLWKRMMGVFRNETL